MNSNNNCGNGMIDQQPPAIPVDNGHFQQFDGYGNPMPLQPMAGSHQPIYHYDPSFSNWSFDQFYNWYPMAPPPPPPQQPQNFCNGFMAHYDPTSFSQVQQNVHHQYQGPQVPLQAPSPTPQPMASPMIPAAPVNHSNFLPTFPNHRANTHPEIRVQLRDGELWRKFHEKSNEMHVNLNGKEIFPRLCFVVSGLKPTSRYQWAVRLVRVCPYLKKWDSVEKCWRITETQDTGRLESKELYSSVKTGKEWEKSGVKDFEKSQIHNTVSEQNKGKLSVERKKKLEEKTKKKMNVNSFCTYQPVLSLVELSGDGDYVVSTPRGSFQFPETEFVVVTEYYSSTVKAMKTKYNKFNRKDRQKKASKELETAEEQLGGRSGLDSGYETSSRGSAASPMVASPPLQATPFPSQYFGADGSAPSTSSQF